jgi:hypothetical protein
MYLTSHLALAALILASCADGTEGEAPISPPAAGQQGDDSGLSLQSELPLPSAPPASSPSSFWGDARLEPAAGTFFGASLNLSTDSMDAFGERLGHGAADFVAFVGFPMDTAERSFLDTFFQQADEQGALAVVTLEPSLPLADITPEMADDLAASLAHYNEVYELGIFVRFAHEMNGSWYSWGQQPLAYVDAYRRVADAVHREAPHTAMLWAPSYGGGYPFPGGAHLAQPGTDDFDLLDTDHDGVLTLTDDPYLPYYPGDDAVDWVGLSLYHWGSAYPWEENEVPEPNKFVDEILGTYDGLAGDQTAVPDFYEQFVQRHDKPMAIVETGALYIPEGGGASELDLKSAWWDQVFAPEVAERFPRLRLINWFEMVKESPEVDGTPVDWTVTIDPTIREAFLADLPVERLIFGPIPALRD